MLAILDLSEQAKLVLGRLGNLEVAQMVRHANPERSLCFPFAQTVD